MVLTLVGVSIFGSAFLISGGQRLDFKPSLTMKPAFTEFGKKSRLFETYKQKSIYTTLELGEKYVYKQI